MLHPFKTHLIILLCFQLLFLHQIRIDYIPNDILRSCLFPPSIFIIHAVNFQAVTDQEIFKQFFIRYVYKVLGTRFGNPAFYNKVSNQQIILKIISCDFYSLPGYLFFHRRLTVTQSAVVCLYSFSLHFFCNDVLCMPCMDLKIQQYNKLEKDDD